MAALASNADSCGNRERHHRRCERKRPRMKSTLIALTALLPVSAALQAQEAASDSAMVQRAIHVCAACHGDEGRSDAPVYPRLAGQTPLYIAAQLRDFRAQTRAESDWQAYMWGVSALLDDATITGLASYYAQQRPAPGKAGDPKLIEAGRKIFQEGIAARGVRACASCHGDNAEGASVFPRLAGQHAEYVIRQLKVFRTRLRPHGVIMADETRNLSDPEMRAVAQYVQSR
jgi:cytochrome c553